MRPSNGGQTSSAASQIEYRTTLNAINIAKHYASAYFIVALMGKWQKVCHLPAQYGPAAGGRYCSRMPVGTLVIPPPEIPEVSKLSLDNFRN